MFSFASDSLVPLVAQKGLAAWTSRCNTALNFDFDVGIDIGNDMYIDTRIGSHIVT